MKLSAAVCDANGWKLDSVRFYTGVPNTRLVSDKNSQMWHDYWMRRLDFMRRAGIIITCHKLHYFHKTYRLPYGAMQELMVPQEKGIDLRL